jgi:hypothetical protein
MNELAILAIVFVLVAVIVPILRGNSQHMADKANSREEHEEWLAEKADVGSLGCKTIFVIVLLAGVFILIASKG